MNDGLNLSLPERKSKSEQGSRLIPGLIVIVLAVGLVNLFYLINGVPVKAAKGTGPGLSAEQLKALALKLEKATLKTEAAEFWKEYLTTSDLREEEQAKVWYRVGKLLQEKNQLGEAVKAYYRSESISSIPALEPEINSAIQACLEGMGKFSGLRYELAERTAVDKEKADLGAAVIAEIGKKKITEAELDLFIEDQIDSQMAVLAAHLPEQEKNKRKEELFAQLSGSAQKAQILNQMIIEELLYRKAREDQVAEDPDIKRFIDKTERGILSAKVIEREMNSQIKISPADLQTYFKAHQDRFVEEEKIFIAHVLVKEEGLARAVIDELKDGLEFAELAGKYSLDEDTREKGGELEAPLTKGDRTSALGAVPELFDKLLALSDGEYLPEVVQSSDGSHVIKVLSRQEKHQKKLDEVKQEVFRELRAAKEAEVKAALFKTLTEKYDVVIHQRHLQPKENKDAK